VEFDTNNANLNAVDAQRCFPMHDSPVFFLLTMG